MKRTILLLSAIFGLAGVGSGSCQAQGSVDGADNDDPMSLRLERPVQPINAAPTFQFKKSNEFTSWIERWCHPNACAVALCHGTCAGGHNAHIFDSVSTDAQSRALAEYESSVESPCPLRTFKGLLSSHNSGCGGGCGGASSSGACCSAETGNAESECCATDARTGAEPSGTQSEPVPPAKSREHFGQRLQPAH